jgi:uncharacterized protein (TIGR02145 family)
MKRIRTILIHFSVVVFFMVIPGCFLFFNTEEDDKNKLPSFLGSVPIVHTLDATSITMTSADCHGELYWGGQSPVTIKGFCWSSLHDPGIEDTIVQAGPGLTFSATLKGLKANRKYLFRAFATNSYGTGLSDLRSFTTLPEIPVVTTSWVVNLTDKTAEIGGDVISEGLTTVTERGVFWGLAPVPEITGTIIPIGDGAGLFSSALTALNPGTMYYIKAYAIYNSDTVYGNQLNFKTREGSIVDVEGNIYYYQTIGNQVWMTENLKTTKYSNGTPIPLVTRIFAWDSLTDTSKAYCWYNGDTNNKDVYGGLYTWAAAMNGAESSSSSPSGVQGVCPTGWHLPSNAEWIELYDYLGGELVAGGKLKEAGITHWQNPNTGATNESGFTALPGGTRAPTYGFSGIGNIGNWWSSTEYDPTFIYGLNLLNASGNLGTSKVGEKANGFSVRCVKN